MNIFFFPTTISGIWYIYAHSLVDLYQTMWMDVALSAVFGKGRLNCMCILLYNDSS